MKTPTIYLSSYNMGDVTEDDFAAWSARGTAEPMRRRRGRPAVAGVPRKAAYELRYTDEERARWEAAAAAQGLRLSDWIRISLATCADLAMAHSP